MSNLLAPVTAGVVAARLARASLLGLPPRKLAIAGSSKTTIQVLRPSASAAATARGDLAGSPCHGDKPRPTAIANVNKWVGVRMGRSEEHTSELQSLMRNS